MSLIKDRHQGLASQMAKLQAVMLAPDAQGHQWPQSAHTFTLLGKCPSDAPFGLKKSENLLLYRDPKYKFNSLMFLNLPKPQYKPSAGHCSSPAHHCSLLRDQDVCVTSKTTQFGALKAISGWGTFPPNPRLLAPHSNLSFIP